MVLKQKTEHVTGDSPKIKLHPKEQHPFFSGKSFAIPRIFVPPTLSFSEERKKRKVGKQTPEAQPELEGMKQNPAEGKKIGRQAPEPKPEPEGTRKSWWKTSPSWEKKETKSRVTSPGTLAWTTRTRKSWWNRIPFLRQGTRKSWWREGGPRIYLWELEWCSRLQPHTSWEGEVLQLCKLQDSWDGGWGVHRLPVREEVLWIDDWSCSGPQGIRRHLFSRKMRSLIPGKDFLDWNKEKLIEIYNTFQQEVQIADENTMRRNRWTRTGCEACSNSPSEDCRVVQICNRHLPASRLESWIPLNLWHLSSVQNPCWLMIAGDYTTQHIGDYNHPIEESL